MYMYMYGKKYYKKVDCRLQIQALSLMHKKMELVTDFHFSTVFPSSHGGRPGYS